MGDWAWDGGRPSVDLLNTVRDRAVRPRETLHTPEDLAGWLRAAELPAGTATEADLETARGLRDAIDLLTREPSDEAVAVINALAAVQAPRLLLVDGRLSAVAPEPSVAAALARIALDAIELLTGGDPLRECAADDCGLRFVDRSPARNRQWCSMRRCGNRTKARRHYERAHG